MKMLMITWTDVFEGTGSFFQLIFKGMRMMGQGPNVLISIFIISLLSYWTFRLMRYRKQSQSQQPGAE